MIAQLLNQIFFSGLDHYAVGRKGENGEVIYNPVEGKPGQSVIEQHLNGEIVLGAYQLDRDNKVRWACFDVDCPDLDKAKEMTLKLCEALDNLPYAVEFSGSKGYHVFCFFKRPEPAERVKEIVDTIHRNLGFARSGEAHVEVYPKQTELNERNPYGNLIKLPLGVHPKSGNRSVFVDPGAGWERGITKDPMLVLSKEVPFTQFQSKRSAQDPEIGIVNILHSAWKEGARHQIALYISGFLAIEGWEVERVKSLIEQVCELAGDTDLDNRLACVTDTYAAYTSGKPVAGYQGLAEYLSAIELDELAELVGRVGTSNIVAAIDRIRIEKGKPPFLKVRSVTNTINNHLKEKGRIVTSAGLAYWINQETKDLYAYDSPAWAALLYNRFGVNPAEGFGSQVIEGLRLSCMEIGREVNVQRRAYYDGKDLWLSLGGKEIYILDGNTEHVTYNGETDVFFRNQEDTMHFPNLLELGLKPLSPWPFLTDDISYVTSEDASADPDEQCELTKVWIMCPYFSTVMRTKPILCYLGPPGSGKTTAGRRILRIIEGPQEEVLSLAMDKPDSFRTTVANHRCIVLDNMEKTKAAWLLDDLNRLSTGTKLELRKLYTTNDIITVEPNVFIICTGTEIPFAEETLYSRLLPIEMSTLNQPKPEYLIQLELERNAAAVQLGMMQLVLNPAVKALQETKEIIAPTSSRLADFAAFVYRLKDCPAIDGTKAVSGVNNLTNQQKRALQMHSPFVQTLELWISAEPVAAEVPRSMNELYNIMSEVARKHYVKWIWNNGRGLAQHLRMLEEQLVRYYGLEIKEVQDSSKGRTMKTYSFKISRVTQ